MSQLPAGQSQAVLFLGLAFVISCLLPPSSQKLVHPLRGTEYHQLYLYLVTVTHASSQPRAPSIQEGVTGIASFLAWSGAIRQCTPRDPSTGWCSGTASLLKAREGQGSGALCSAFLVLHCRSAPATNWFFNCLPVAEGTGSPGAHRCLLILDGLRALKGPLLPHPLPRRLLLNVLSISVTTVEGSRAKMACGLLYPGFWVARGDQLGSEVPVHASSGPSHYRWRN